MKVVVLGAGGLWGRALVTAAERAGHSVMALGREALDVTDGERVASCLRELGPDWVFNAAAWARMERCREDPDGGYRVNVEAPVRLGRLAGELGFWLCHASSDYVFAGEQRVPYSEEDREEPLSVYGRQKLEADEKLLGGGEARVLVVRVAW
ncbi:MAG: sugar nucleotide-binding protein, partial [Verrucomicrobiia bacterium]